MATSTTKLQLISELLESTTREITQSRQLWTDYLTAAANMYKYSFNDQVLIYAQRPTATACMELDMWNSRMRRWIAPGSKGIALIDENGTNLRLRYVFDVSDTRIMPDSREVNMWHMREEHALCISNTFERLYGEVAGSFENKLLFFAAHAVSENYDEYFLDLMSVKSESFLEQMSKEEAGTIFLKTVMNSVKYQLLSRCGLDADMYIANDAFNDIYQFNTPEVLSCMGNAISDISENLLRQVERAVKQYDKENLRTPIATEQNIDYNKFNTLKRERNNKDVEHIIHAERGLSPTKSGTGRNVGGHRQIREPSENSPQRASQEHLQRNAVDGQAVAASAGNQQHSAETDRPNGVRVENARGGNGSSQGIEPNGVGSPNEQSDSISGGNSPKRVGLQLNLFPTAGEQIEQIELAGDEKSSAFSLSSEEINHILKRGSGFSQGKFRIYQHFQSSPSEKESIVFLKREYGIGGCNHTFFDGTTGWVDNDSRGIQIRKHAKLGEKPDVFLTWPTASKLLRTLVLSDNYLTAQEKDRLPSWKEEQQTAAMESAKAALERPTATLPPVPKHKGDFEQLSLGNLSHSSAVTIEDISDDNVVDDTIESPLATIEPESSKSNSGEASEPDNSTPDDARLAAGIAALKKKISNSTEGKNYRTFKHLFPKVLDDTYRYMRLQAGEGFMPLYVERIDDDVYAVAHTYTQNGDMMYDPEMTFRVDRVRETLEPLTYEQSGLLLYQNVYPEQGKWIPKLRRDLLSFSQDWFRNIRNQEYVPELAKSVINGEDIEVLFDNSGAIITENAPITVNPIVNAEPIHSDSSTIQLSENYRLPSPLPITTLEWDSISTDYKSVRENGSRAILINENGATTLAPIIIDDENGLETSKFLFEENGLTYSCLAYTEQEALQIIRDTGHTMSRVQNLRSESIRQDKTADNGTIFNDEELADLRERLQSPAQEDDSRIDGMLKFAADAYQESQKNIEDWTAATTIGNQLTIGNRLYEIAEYNSFYETVQLRDATFQNGVGFPIFRKESVEFVINALRQSQSHEVIKDFEENEQLSFGMVTTSDKSVQISEPQHSAIPNSGVDTLKWEKVRGGEVSDTNFTSPTESINSQQQRINFHITDDDLGAGGQKSKYVANIAAIKKLQEIESDNRLATPEEQEILSRYVGWGGIPQAFDAKNDKWQKEYVELKSLLSLDKYDSARASTLNAHYTSPTVIKAMYTALERMGFKTGNILEPACGVGNFLGLVPESMAKSKLYGVELDSITGRLAKQLYQKADITVSGFEKTSFSDDFFDLAVGNVPFGDYKLSDRKFDKQNLLIHDYFFAKTFDKVRSGGLIAFVTSKGTMDKQNSSVRKYLSSRGDLLGAIRLPNTAFKQNAGTEVTSDILFFQKRDRIPEQEPDWVHIGKTEDGVPLNNYFLEHPENVLGTMAWNDGMYGNQTETACLPFDGANLSEQLAAAIKNIGLPSQDALELSADELLSVGGTLDFSRRESLPADPNVRNFSYTLVDGELYFRENSRMNPVEVGKIPAARMRGMIELRDCTRNLIDLQLFGASDAAITDEQSRLNRLYDRFTSKHGLVNSIGNKQAFEQDSAYPLLCSLEVIDENGKLERKADMFTKRTIQRHRAVSDVDTAIESLAVSISEKACIDLGYMASLMGGSDKIGDIAKDLQGIIFKDPETGAFDLSLESKTWSVGWQTADEYLSGNVREKLDVARKIADTDPAFAVNVNALEQVQTKELKASEIDVRIGATWIAPQYYRQFMFELLQTPSHLQDRYIDVLYSEYTNEWSVKGKSADDKRNTRVFSKYGTERRNAYSIFEDCLNLRDSRVYDIKIEDGKEKRVLNSKQTAIALQKQETISDAFKAWIWKDPERRTDLCKTYNEIFNSVRPREYDGSHINFVGMNPEISLRKHQLDAVAHILYGKNTLLAHCVGAGKTYEMIAAAMESKRLGLCQKSLYVVPNHLTDQWGGDFLRLYPGANILVATKKDFEPQNRKKFCARIATGDYDAVIIGHSQFEKIPLSPHRQKEILQNQVHQIVIAIENAKRENGEKYTIKQMEKTKRSLESRLEKLNDESRKDNVVSFEELGVDRLFVDEAHYYKNLFTFTKMRNIAGIGQNEAKKSSDMYAKCRYMDELTDGRGITFATGTPVSNSMTELYTMMRYLQYDTLEKHGLQHFDSWAASFGEKVTAIELAPEGTGFRSKTRFARFFNLPELISMWKEAADIQTADMLNLPIPQAEHITEVMKPSAHQKNMVQELAERADIVRKMLVEPNEDNMLKITSEGRKLALDQRLQNDLLPDDPESKVNRCVGHILDVWHDTANVKGAQLVFCDLSTPKAISKEKEEDTEKIYVVEDDTDLTNFSVYQDIKNKLMSKSIPSHEVAFIHEAKTEAQKAELFARVRKGQIRVLLGSTNKMGAGTNVQDRLVALHHLDCPWRPADLEQREGRILRQGNKNEKVKIYKYVTEGTFDAYNWSLIENKQKFIGQIMTSKSPARSAEDVDATALSYAEVKALATGDVRIKEKMDLDVQVTKLKLLKSNHDGQRYELEDMLVKYYPQEIKKTTARIAAFESDQKTLAENPVNDDSFSMTIMNHTFSERKEAGAALIELCKAIDDPDKTLQLGDYRGFPMTLFIDSHTEKFKVSLKQGMSYIIELGGDVVGNIIRISNALESVPKNLSESKSRLDELHVQQSSAKEDVALPFLQAQELAEKSARLTVLNTELSMDKNDDSRESDESEVSVDDKRPSVKQMIRDFESDISASSSGVIKREKVGMNI